MITATQILAHLWGDYIFQSDWMAQNKTKAHWPAFVHAFVYSLCFLPLCWRWMPYYSLDHGMTVESMFPDIPAWLMIFGTHFFIDRYRLARYVVWAKNFLAPRTIWFCDYGCHREGTEYYKPEKCGTCRNHKVRNLPFADCAATGYLPSSPAWLSVWLLIIADNILHLTINGAALKFL